MQNVPGQLNGKNYTHNSVSTYFGIGYEYSSCYCWQLSITVPLPWTGPPTSYAFRICLYI